MADLIHEWFRRKVGMGIAPLRAISTVTHEVNHVAGPRSVYAKVTLSISPSDQFVFESRARWPEANYDEFVIDGILDALFGEGHTPMLAARFVLLEVGWHPVNSAPIAYYQATKFAVRSVISGSD